MLLDRVAVILLALMSAYVIVAIARALKYAVAGLDPHRLKREVGEAIRLHGIEEAFRVCDHHRKSLLTVVIRTALAEIKKVPYTDRGAFERGRAAFSHVCALKTASFKRDTRALKTIGQTAVLLGVMTSVFDICAILDNISCAEGLYPDVFDNDVAPALRFAAAGMLISLIAIWTHRFIRFRIESAEAEADRSFLELSEEYTQHRSTLEGIERIQRTGLQIWEHQGLTSESLEPDH